MKIVLTDMDENILKKVDFTYEDITFEYSDNKVEGPALEDEQLFEELDHKVNVFMPTEDGNDFIVRYFSKKSSDSWATNFEEVQGRYFSEVFPFFKKVGVIEYLKEANEQHDVSLMELRYIEGTLINAFRHDLLKVDDCVYHLMKNESDLYILNYTESKIFKDSTQPSFIIVGYKFVECNDALLDFFNISKEQFLSTSIGFDFIEDSSWSQKDLNELISDILNRKVFFGYNECAVNTPEGEKLWLRFYFSSITYKGRPAVKCSFDDFTEVKENEMKIKQLGKDLEVVQRMSKIAMGSNNSGKVFWNSELFHILEISPDEYEELDDEYFILGNYVPDEDKDNIVEPMKSWSPENNPIIFSHRIITGKGNVKYIKAQLKAKFDSEGKQIFSAGYIQDITEEKLKENEMKDSLLRLESNLDKLQTISEELAAISKDKEFLLTEVHHRVKNNLQIILSLLNLDLRYNLNDPSHILTSTKERINSMALIHEKVYKSKDLINVNFKDYIEDMSKSLLNYHSVDVDFVFDLNDLYLSMESVVPLGLILNELLNNALSYAFPSGKGQVTIRLKRNLDTDQAYLIVEDNGVGIEEGIDFDNSPSLGLTIIKSLTDQLEGEVKFIEGEGTAVRVDFPIVKD